MKPTNLKELLAKGTVLTGPFVRINDPAVLEILGRAGFDFAILDLEHGSYSNESAEDLVRAAQLAGLSPVVRIRGNDPTLISRALDIGAAGIQVPQVSTGAEAAAAVKGAYFYPYGERGVCRYVRAAAYSHLSKDDYFKSANENTTVIVQIEGEKGIRHIDEIILVKGIDVIFIGPYDLSQSLGVPGEVEHPLLLEKMEDVTARAEAAGLAVGTFVEDIAAARKWAALGVRYLVYSIDVGILYRSCRKIAGELITLKKGGVQTH